MQSELAKFGFPSADIANFAVRIVEAALACNWVGDGLFASSGQVGYPGTVSTADASPEKFFDTYPTLLGLHFPPPPPLYSDQLLRATRSRLHLVRPYKLLCAGRKKELG
ncbi:MAG TPA: hypothetical protein VK818_13710 [Methylomirabilota bacterium]|nr:hypothetical protein [Methylomirabilota bacterium]